MRTLFCALATCALFLTSLHASADIVLVKADSLNTAESGDMNQHRYEGSIKKMDSDSDHIASQLMNHNRNLKAHEASDNSGLQVTLIKIRR